MTSHGKIQVLDQLAINSSQFLNQGQNHQVSGNDTYVQSKSHSKSEETSNKTNSEEKLPNLQQNTGSRQEHRERKYNSDNNSAMGSWKALKTLVLIEPAS